jgi:GMP synthase (glutamine-hydrolysing)
MPGLQVLQHVPMEGAARIGEIAEEMGLAVVTHALCDGAAVPATVSKGDMLVVMGGSMGVGDIGDPRWPFLAPEVDLIRKQLRAGAPVLGICLGAQLMAHALGARVYPLEVGEPPTRHREVGWGGVTFAGGNEPGLAGLNDAEVVLHWHGDTFDLPHDAVLLASTLACQNQMFRFGARAYAIQFHVELLAEDMEMWVHEDAAFVKMAGGPRGGARILRETPRFMPRFRQMGDRLIRNVLSAMLDPAAS